MHKSACVCILGQCLLDEITSDLAHPDGIYRSSSTVKVTVQGLQSHEEVLELLRWLVRPRVRAFHLLMFLLDLSANTGWRNSGLAADGIFAMRPLPGWMSARRKLIRTSLCPSAYHTFVIPVGPYLSARVDEQ